MTSTYHHGNLRAVLLKNAVKTLGTAGIEKLSLRALARDLGVSHAAPLRHFKTKTDLLSAIAIEGAQSLMACVNDAQTHEPEEPRLLLTSIAYIDWALENPAYYVVLRNQEVMRHASDELGALLNDFAERQKAEIVHAQAGGWRVQETPEDLYLQLTALTVGLSVVATDKVYGKPSGMDVSRDRLVQSIKTFLELSPQTFRKN